MTPLAAFSPWRLRVRTSRLSGWKATLTVFLAGALGALAMAPLHIWPALVVALVILFWSVDGARRGARTRRTATWRGFMFGMGYFLAGTFWLGFAFINRGPEFIPLIPLALPIFAAMLAAFWGLAMLGYVLVAQNSVWRVLTFAAVLATFEWLRGHIFSGLPWNLPAYAWPAGGAMSQAAAWFGVYGLTFLTLFAFAAPAVAFARGARLQRALPVLTAITLLAVLFSSGAYRLGSVEVPDQPGVRIRIVHMAITQQEKWGEDGAELARDRYLAMTASPGLDEVTHVIWPEGALPTFMLEDGRTMAMIGEVLGDGPVLMSGINRRERVGDSHINYYNALAVLRFPGGTPRLDTIYDKVRLVPFTETIPLAWLIAAIGFEDFSRLQFDSGLGPYVLDVEGAPPVMPLICYEAIFPDFVAAAPQRPSWLLNISNDAWFGPTSGPLQHINQARYRSIETGLPMVRSASRGISGVIDAFGRPVISIGRDAEGAYDVALPGALEETPYLFWRDRPFWLLCLIIIAGSGVQRWRRRGESSKPR